MQQETPEGDCLRDLYGRRKTASPIVESRMNPTDPLFYHSIHLFQRNLSPVFINFSQPFSSTSAQCFPIVFSGSSPIRLLRGSGFTGKVRREGFFRDIFSFPVLSRRCPGKFTKSSREIIGIWNSDLIRDFGNRKGGALQKMGGPPQHRIFPVLPGRNAGFLLELRIKCCTGISAESGDLIDGITTLRQKFLCGPDRRGDL